MLFKVFAAVLIGLAFCSPADAKGRPAPAVQLCASTSDPSTIVRACTSVIRDGLAGADAAWAYNNRGTGYRQLGAAESALADFNVAIELEPANPTAYENRANLRLDLGEYAVAIEDLDMVLAIDPRSATAFNSRGIARFGLGDVASAIDDFGAAISLDGGYLEAIENRGNALLDVPDLGRAIEAFEDAYELAPDDPSVQNSLAWARYLNGDPAGGLPLAERSAASSPMAYNVDTLAHILAALGRREDARAQFERAMDLGGAAQIVIYQEALIAQGLLQPEDWSGVYDPATEAALESCLRQGCRLVE